MRWRDWFHIHSDPNWKLDFIWQLHECRCGARRVRLHVTNYYGPVPDGWPQPYDSHGQALNDSGWVGGAR